MPAKTLLITGANRGIGFALTEQAVARGDVVIATARKPADADRLNALAGLTGKIEVHPLDVLDEASVAALAERLGGRRVDLLVANAGVLNAYGRIDDDAHDFAAWSSVLLTNVFGPYAVARALLPNLTPTDAAAPAGKIAVISSAMGSTARAPGGAYPYRASKAAATNLARNLATDLAPRRIAVGAYHPGWVRTDMGGPSADIAVEESAAGLLERFDALTPETTGVVESYAGEPVPY